MTTPPRLAVLEIAGLSTAVVAQPVLDLLGRNPEWLVLVGATNTQTVVTAIALLLGVPLAVTLIWLGVRRMRPGSGEIALAGVAASGGFLLGSEVARLTFEWRGWRWLVTAVGCAAVFALARHRSSTARQLLRVFAIGLPVSAVLFFFTSPASVLFDGGRAVTLGGITAQRTPPIVVLLLDELPLATIVDHGRVDEENFPNLARLARTSTWFRSATSTAGSTAVAVPSILSGHLPAERGTPPLASEYPDNLFSLLRGTYRFDVRETLTALCGADDCGEHGRSMSTIDLMSEVAALWRELALPGGDDRAPADRFGEEVDDALIDVGSDPDRTTKASNHLARRHGRFDEFVDSLDRFAGGGAPPLIFYHLLLPHTPFRFTHDGSIYPQVKVGDGSGYLVGGQDYPRRFLQLQHHEQARYTDARVGDLMDRLSEVGLWDDALVAVVSDHGTAFADAWRVLGDVGGETLIPIPFFVKLPGQKDGEIRDGNVWTTDLVPTIAGALGAEIPWDADGIDALQDSRADGFRPWGNATVRELYDAEPLIRGALRGLLSQLEPSGPDGLNLGPMPSLIGTRVAVAGPAGATGVVSLQNSGSFSEVPNSNGNLPLSVVGSVEGVDLVGQALAVAIDGRIVATSEFYLAGAETRFAVMLPTHTFADVSTPSWSFHLFDPDSEDPDLLAIG